MRPQRLGGVICVVALQTNKQTSGGKQRAGPLDVIDKQWTQPDCDATVCHYWGTIYFRGTSLRHAVSVWRDPCLLTTLPATPPAATAWYIYCRRLLCANQARGRAGLEAILGWKPEQSVCGQLGRSLESEVASFHTGKNPSESRQKVRRGVTPTIFVLLNFLGLHLLFGWNLRGQTHTHHWFWRLQRQCWPPTSRRIQTSPPTNLHCICEHFCDPP